ncbi:MAG: tRNA uridine(34) 5-carboxymethylaminomethyl modification radical SAM/GNAT enzyme Elp3 [Candidatus Beckwithbacteria bacterium]|nr:tRNA uridine(34) 5-carboxymethylaminomethyl modification radical SAM/GNAT enzyme Elp3 [Candidatus Beckwithbacteria bacterium]
MAKFDFNPKTYEKKLQPLIKELAAGKNYDQVLRRFPKTATTLFTKAEVISGLRYFNYPPSLVAKPVRTLSGVVPVTLLTKPYPCPGRCLYCPNDPRMPKSYLPNEPGGQRAVANQFNPYRQVISRLKTYQANGHPTDKIELIILGGTWSAYPRAYQIWFIKRCFEALNGQKSVSLAVAQKINETATNRCVGLSLETRPDWITKPELIRFRHLGCTKVQIGIQSLSDRILKLNQRGHTVAATKKAIKLLRLYGFKIQAHWMANLYGATPKTDIADFKKLFSDKNFRPDELKIYPCSLIKSAPLYLYYQKNLWRPYTQSELIKVLTQTLPLVPPYCRVSRMIRDFSASDIVSGNKTSNLRQLVEQKTTNKIKEIRFREIRNEPWKNLTLKIISYQTSVGEEKFLQWVTEKNKLCAFLRLSLPKNKTTAMIRELHVYGQALALGGQARVQHAGLGKKLIMRAAQIAKKFKYQRVRVISSVGTREYYRRLGFIDRQLYQSLTID